MSARARRRQLKFAVKNRLLPHVRSLGFESIKAAELRDRWAGRNPHDFSLGRAHGGRLDFLDVYWEKYGRPEFDILFATCEEGAEERMEATWFQGRLHSGHHVVPWGILGFGGNWFGPHQSAEAAVDLAIQRVNELDAWLRDPHRRVSARVVQFGFNDYAPTLAGHWLHFALIVTPRWLGRTWRRLRGATRVQ